MPSHETHVYCDKLFFGKSYRRIHRLIDSAYRQLGVKHRILFHDPMSGLALAGTAYPNDSNALLAALLHVKLDETCSADPRLRKGLELLAKMDAQKRRQSRKKMRTNTPRRKPALSSV